MGIRNQMQVARMGDLPKCDYEVLPPEPRPLLLINRIKKEAPREASKKVRGDRL